MNRTTEKAIQLSALQLDRSNPRHGDMDSQVETVEWMINGGKGIGEKLLALAKDIIQWGLNPSDRIKVIEAEDSPGKYIVMEGNRRITALKLLANPELAPTAAWRKRFSLLVKQKRFLPIKSVLCVVYSDLDALYHFIELKHMGSSGGAGTVEWDAYQKARHDKRKNKKSRYHKAYALIEEIKKNHHSIYGHLPTLINQDFSITTLDRMLSDATFREFLGLDINANGDLIFIIDKREAGKPIQKLMTDLVQKKINVSDVKNIFLRTQYMNSFPPEHIPRDRSRPESAIYVGEPTTPELKNKERRPEPTTPAATTFDNSRHPDPGKRKFVVLKGEHLPIDPKSYQRPYKIFGELKELKIDTNPNAVAMLLRSFIEMSVMVFLSHHNIQPPAKISRWEDMNLQSRIECVNNWLYDHRVQSLQEKKVVSSAFGSKNKPANPNYLNDLVHNHHQVVSRAALIEIWDTYRYFLQLTWSQLK